MAMARGLLEVTKEAYQEYRHSQIELLAGLLRDAGVPIVEPPGGHAVYIDAKRFLPHIPQYQFPAQVCQLSGKELVFCVCLCVLAFSCMGTAICAR